MLVNQSGGRSSQIDFSADLLETFRIVATHVPVGIFQTDAVGDCVFLNQRCLELTGFSLPQVMGKGWVTALHPEDRDRVFHDWYAAAHVGQEFRAEYRFQTPQGQINWVLGSAIALHDATGNLTGYLGTVTDISVAKCLEEGRKSAELQLREMSAALSNAVEGISRLDAQGHYLAANEAYASAVGYTPAEMIGMHWQETVHPEDLAAVVSTYQHMLNTGKVELETRGIRKDGSTFYKQLVMISAYDDQQRFVGHYCFMKDITVRKRLEAEKGQLEAQFLRAQRLEGIGTLASGIAHDLNNILTPVLAIAQLLPLKLPHLDEATQTLLEVLEINAKRGADLVKQVLAFARGNDGQRTPLQVGHLLSEASKIAQQTFPKSIRLRTHILTQDLCLVSADATQLHQVIMNLCVNARDAMPEGGTLTISAENCVVDDAFARLHLDAQVGSHLKITIADTGMGIPPEVFDRIFDPFFTTKEQGKGTGLGLSTVRTIIKNHGGFIDVKTEVGHGTSFQIYLPALEQGEPPAISILEHLEGNDELILVIDDEGAIGETIKVVLEAYQYRTLVARDGVEAISLYAQHSQQIMLVLLDLMMPMIDGFKLIEILAQLNPQVQIIAMSGLATQRDQAMQRNSVQAFLPKPFTTEDLLNAINGVCRSGFSNQAVN